MKHRPKLALLIIPLVSVPFLSAGGTKQINKMEDKKTEFENRRALILNDHPHAGETAICLGTDKTSIGWAMKFKNEETSVEFYVWNGKDVCWLNER